MTRRKLIAGNWKMNGVGASLDEVRAIVAGAAALDGVDLMICPPATLIARLADVVAGSSVKVGGQDCHAKVSGAHTGDISAQMLRDAGAHAVIVGHSERRTDHGETSEQVAAKAEAAFAAGLIAIVCVGETRAERDAGMTLDVIGGQLDASIPARVPAGHLVIAYEPVWAIGTGLTPTTGDVAGVHAFIRERLAARFGDAGRDLPILYGGSVKPANARELMAVSDVDGALVGGASLKATDFLGIATGAA
jgi:triosephosphate isomerase